jgi:hypothetical protein
MSRFILLDAGPLGLVTGSPKSAEANACRTWLETMLAAGVNMRVPDITDYEVRRELLRARRMTGVQQIDALRARIGHLAVTTETLFLASPRMMPLMVMLFSRPRPHCSLGLGTRL